MREGLAALCLGAALALVGFGLSAAGESGDAVNTVGGVLIAGAVISALVGLGVIGADLVRGESSRNEG